MRLIVVGSRGDELLLGRWCLERNQVTFLMGAIKLHVKCHEINKNVSNTQFFFQPDFSNCSSLCFRTRTFFRDEKNLVLVARANNFENPFPSESLTFINAIQILSKHVNGHVFIFHQYFGDFILLGSKLSFTLSLPTPETSSTDNLFFE